MVVLALVVVVVMQSLASMRMTCGPSNIVMQYWHQQQRP